MFSHDRKYLNNFKGRPHMKLHNVISSIALLCWSFIPAHAAQPDRIINTIDRSIQKRQETQKKSADWQTQKDRLKGKYFQLKEDIELADIEIKHMQEIVRKQDAYIQRTNRKVLEMEKIRQQLIPYLHEVIARMELSIKNDLPFLPAERSGRVSVLKDIVNDPEVPLGEKLRRVFEGLRVEMDYGKSVETTKEEIAYKGQKVLVNVFRMGRTSLMMQTLDEKEIAMFNGTEWVELPGKYFSEIKKAIEISQRRRPVDFVNIPIRGVEQ